MEIKSFFDFCSGIGGGRLGLEQCGLECVGRSETSRLSEVTYKLMHNTENEKNHGNLKKIDTSTIPKYDLLIAGFPCQSFSVIGRKDGFLDMRGQIIFHLARIMRETKPKAFLLENVRGLVSHEKGKTLEVILNELNRSGYDVIYKVMNSLDHGVPQMRQRVYIIGFDKKYKINTDLFIWPEYEKRPPLSKYLIDNNNYISEENYNSFSYYLKNPTNKGIKKPDDFNGEEYLVVDTRMSDLRLYRERVPTLRSHRDGVYYIKNRTLRELTGYEALLLQGFPKKYADKVKIEVTNRHLLMQAGNAMTVNVIKSIGDSILNMKELYMTNWVEFEKESVDFLNKQYANGTCTFEGCGGADSTIPDIKVHLGNGESFFIEAKMAGSQSGQFVLFADEKSKSFIFSERNKHKLNSYSQKIIDHMNVKYDLYTSAGTKGKAIDLDHEILEKWIIDFYKNKGVKFIITGVKGSFTIFPIEHLPEYFNVSATYRMKKSGSSNPAKSNISELDSLIGDICDSYEIQQVGKKIFILTESRISDIRVYGEKYSYLIREYQENIYEVRRLSNTFNFNVIFSLLLKKDVDQNEEHLTEFVRSLA